MLAYAGEVYETGYFLVTYTRRPGSLDVYDVTANMTADRGLKESDFRGFGMFGNLVGLPPVGSRGIDWFPASPLRVEGKYSMASGLLELHAGVRNVC